MSKNSDESKNQRQKKQETVSVAKHSKENVKISDKKDTKKNKDNVEINDKKDTKNIKTKNNNTNKKDNIANNKIETKKINNKNKKTNIEDEQKKEEIPKEVDKNKDINQKEIVNEDVTTTNKENVKLIKFEEIKNIFKKKNKIPNEELKEINKPVFYNILVAIILMLYYIFLILGFYNIENSVYQTDLKVFALCILFLAIVLIEKAYKNDSGKIALFGIETIVISIATIGLIYVNLMYSSNYVSVVLIISYISSIYYVIKSIVIYQKGKKKYFVNDVKNMINTEE